MNNEDRPHIESSDCWCNPTVEYVPGKLNPAPPATCIVYEPAEEGM